MKWALIWWLLFSSYGVATGHVDGFTSHKACSEALTAMVTANKSTGYGTAVLTGVCVPLDVNAP